MLIVPEFFMISLLLQFFQRKISQGFANFQVTELKIKYFDTVAVSNAMCILKTGFLFTASEFGNQ